MSVARVLGRCQTLQRPALTGSDTPTRPPDRYKAAYSFVEHSELFFVSYNSLCQRLYLALRETHSISIEYALSEDTMIEAASLAQPHLIICPFLTSRVPTEIYSNYLTLIIHPGPPGDAGPSALDWVLMGDDGSFADADQLLKENAWSLAGRSHWGVTVLQAVEEFDTGPVWAFEQFKIDINDPEVTKSELYRGSVTRAAITATFAALDRIRASACRPFAIPSITMMPASDCMSQTHRSPKLLLSPNPLQLVSPHLLPADSFRYQSVTTQQPFLGGPTYQRPLLRAAQRGFDIHEDTAHNISRKIRSADSQPGCLTQIFSGISLYVYGGTIENCPDLLSRHTTGSQIEKGPGNLPQPGLIVAHREGAVCLATCDGKGVWISHIRRAKQRSDAFLWPKIPAVMGLRELGLLKDVSATSTSYASVNWSKALHSTFQSVWVDFATYNGDNRVAYVYFEFYNGAMGTAQCSQLLEAFESLLDTHSRKDPLAAVVLMGGHSYFGNGIALNVIEADADPSRASWRNINRINDVVQMLLEAFPKQNITTCAALRGNCAAGGVAVATACDFVMAGSDIVLNPAYGAMALYGSEYHTLTYPARCGAQAAHELFSKMCPVSPYEARRIGLVDHVFPGSGHELDAIIRRHIEATICVPNPRYRQGHWKARADLSPTGLAATRPEELGEMAQNFCGKGSEQYHLSRRDFVRKIKPLRTPLLFAEHRQGLRLHQSPQQASDRQIDYWNRTVTGHIMVF